MPTGTLSNLEHSGFVRTPPVWAERIVRNLLTFGAAARVFDPTAGEGDLLAPLIHVAGVDLYGVEISRARAEVARQRLPHAALVVSAIEAVRITPASLDLILANPPYFFEDGRRAEYRILADAGVALRPGGILVAILPARSAWDGVMMNHWCKHYEQVRCWKFPDGDPEQDEGAFQRYTQIVVVGVRRQTPLKMPESLEQQRLAGWRWRQPKKAESPWAQGTPPPVLPEQPIADPYPVPEAGPVLPELLTLNADETTLLEALGRSGVQQSSDWVSATTWQPERQAEQPIMPPTGEAHLAAEILTGLLDGEVLTGPDGQSYVFVTCITQEAHQVALDAEDLERERQKGVVQVEVKQIDDHPVLGVLNLTTGEVAYHQGEAVFTYLTPWLSRLASRVLGLRQPLYRLNPEPWELAVCAEVGLHKQLPEAPHPGLVPPQLHRVFGMGVGLDRRRRVGIQGEPGTGKTLMAIATMARQAALWQQARRGQPDAPLPGWVRSLRLTWQRMPRARALLGDQRRQPAALPVLVAAPKRNTTMWQEEVLAAWPQAEVVMIDSYRDIDSWMRRCATSHTQAVIGIVSHSQSRAFGRQWEPAVVERRLPRRVPDLSPAEALRAELEPVRDQGQLVGYRFKNTGRLLTKVEEIVAFHCPDCGARVEAPPWGQRKESKPQLAAAGADPTEEEQRPSDKEEDALEPVTHWGWFAQKPRWCRHCHAALWTEARLPVIARKTGAVPFATWAAGVEQRHSQPGARPGTMSSLVVRRPDGRLGKARRHPQTGLPAAASRVLDATGRRGPAAPESFSPFEYLYRFYRGCVGLTIVDESHNARGRATDIGHAIHLAQLAAQTCIYASGTHYGGTVDDLYHYWYRFNPRFWQRFGLGWQDVEQAMARFGVIQQWTREHEGEARRGSGRADVTVTTVPAPGISARLLPFLLGDLVFLSVLDVGAHMPPRLETPEIVELEDPALEEALQPAQRAASAAEEAYRAARQQVATLRSLTPPAPEDEQASALADQQSALEQREEAQAALGVARGWVEERDLAKHYWAIVNDLRERAQQGNSAAALAQGTIPRWWAVLPCVEPAYTVEQTQRGKWGETLGKTTMLTAPVLTPSYYYPLERRAQEIVAERVAAGKRVMLYYEQNGQRSMAQRLAWVLGDFHPWTLPNSVEAEDREHAIRAAIGQHGHRVLLVPYRRVMEGLNLQDVVDVIAWYELALNLFHLDQASRRHWRLGRTDPAEIVYLAYAGSAAHRKLSKLARESGAAAAFAGEPAKGALIEQVGAHQTMLARLSASLEALAEEEDLTSALTGQADLQAAFSHRAEELTATLKQGRHWLGLVDTLPEQLAAFHAAPLTRTERIEAAPSVAPAVIPPLRVVAPLAFPRGELVRRSLWEQEEAAANDAAKATPPPVLSAAEVAPMPVQGSITATASSLVLTFAATGAHLETMRQLSRTYGGRFAWSSGAWVLPLLSFRQPVHVVDAVLDAFPTLQGAEDARLIALETMLRHLAARYRVVNGREPNQAAMREQVTTCTEAQRWLRTLEQHRANCRSS